MANKNSLEKVKFGSKKEASKPILENQIKVKDLTHKKPGRKPKPVNEKESEAVPLKFTKSEIAKLKDLAGGIPLATFLKAHIRKEVLKD